MSDDHGPHCDDCGECCREDHVACRNCGHCAEGHSYYGAYCSLRSKAGISCSCPLSKTQARAGGTLRWPDD